MSFLPKSIRAHERFYDFLVRRIGGKPDQDAMAERWHTTQPTVSRWLHGRVPMPYHVAEELMAELDMTLSDIVETPDERGSRIPVVALINAGRGGGGPVEGYEYIGEAALKGKDLRAARVDGDCMAPAIEPGDIVIYDASNKTPRDGQIVVATLLDSPTGEAVLKKWYRHGHKVHLTPNVGEPLVVDGDRVQVEGVVIQARKNFS